MGLTFLLDHLCQELRVCPTLSGCLIRRRQVGLAKRRKTQGLQLLRKFGRVDRRHPDWP